MQESLQKRNEFLQKIHLLEQRVQKQLIDLHWTDEDNLARIVKKALFDIAEDYQLAEDEYYFYHSSFGNLLMDYIQKIIEEKIESLERIKKHGRKRAFLENLFGREDSLYDYRNVCSFLKTKDVFWNQELLTNIIIDGAIQRMEEGNHEIYEYLANISAHLTLVKGEDYSFQVLEKIVRILIKIPEFKYDLIEDAKKYQKILTK